MSHRAFLRSIKSFFLRNTERSKNQIMTFGVVMMFNYPLFYIIWHHLTPQLYTNLPLRLIASALCIPLIFHKKWPEKLKKFFPYYWNMTVIYCLPFFFTFMTLKNHLDFLWLMNCVSVVFFMLLLFDLFEAIILLIIGVILGGLFFHFIAPIAIHLDEIEEIGIASTFIASILIGGLFSFNNKRQEEQRIATMKAVGASIAHELRTPLFAIGSLATAFKRLLPKLLTSYSLAREHGLKTPSISKEQIDILQHSAKDIDVVVESGLVFIDMFNKKVNLTEVPKDKISKLSISQCIDEALRLYPFKPQERAKVNWQKKEDFIFIGNDNFMVHVLFNLLKNALYFIHDARKGEIFIWLEKKAKVNILHFKDTGKGIEKSVLPNIFESFFTKTRHGTGIGLAFCQMVIKEFGGEIICQSREGEYTHFKIMLPVVEEIA